MRNMLNRFVFWTFLLPGIAISALAEPVTVERITPSGDEVAQERGIYVEFNRPIIPLGLHGNVSVEVPITISPQVECEWTWVKRNILACHLSDLQNLQKSTRYTVTIEPGIFAEDGETLTEEVVHEFTTELPKIQRFQVIGWRNPERPYVVIELDQPVTQKSLHGRVEFVVGDSVQVSAEVMPRDWILRRLIEESYFGSESWGNTLEETASFIQQAHEFTLETLEASSGWIVFPTGELPSNKRVSVRLKPGIQSTMGSATHSSDQIYANVFQTFGAFKLLGIQCRNSDRDLIEMRHQSITTSRCTPEHRIELLFSSPVAADQIQPCLETIQWFKGEIEDPWFLESPSWWNFPSYSRFEVSLPSRLQPYSEYKLDFHSESGANNTSVCRDVRDVFGRTLTTSEPLTIRTDHYAAVTRAWNGVSVFESSLAGDTTIHAMNVRDLRLKYDVIGPQATSTGLEQNYEVGDEIDTRKWWSLGLREKTGSSSGVVIGELASRGRFDNKTLESWFFSIATPYHVFAKQGLFETLVWVSSLETGDPVEGAKVHQYWASRSNPAVAEPEGHVVATNEQGVAVLPGYLEFNPTLDFDDRGYLLRRCPEEPCPMMFLRVDGSEGLGLLPISWDFYVYPSASSNSGWIRQSREDVHGYVHAWGTTAQGIYRRGDEVEFKGYVRDKNRQTLAPAPTGPYSVTVHGPTQNVLYEESDIWLSEFGSFDGRFHVPESATMGWYRFKLRFNPEGVTRNQEEETVESDESSIDVPTEMKFFVTDFTPNPLRVTQEFNSDRFELGDQLRVTTRGQFHAGGPYANAEVQVRVRVDASSPAFSGALTEKFHFDFSERERRTEFYNQLKQLNDSGVRETVVDLVESEVYFGRMTVESSVRSDRGKYVSESSTLPYNGVNRYVGLRKESDTFFKSGEEGLIEAVVVDENGDIRANARVEIRLQRREVFVSQVRDSSDNYRSRYVSRWEDTGQYCEIESAEEPVDCKFTPGAAGRYRALATTIDTEGREQQTDLQVWVTGSEYVVWDSGSSERLEMWCDNTQPEVGDSVKCIVQNTLPGAEALVTIEREGVLNHFVQKFESSTPVVEFTVDEDYVPGFYLSVLAAAPRVAPPKPNDSEANDKSLDQGSQSSTADLGKPTYRHAYVRFHATNPQGNIEVSVSTKSTLYRPRDEVAVFVENTNRSEITEDLEYAVLVIDEAVLDLVSTGIEYFDPSKGFQTLGALGIETFALTKLLLSPSVHGDPTALVHLKGSPAGGGGSTDESRNIEKYVAYWNPSIRSNDGKAHFSFKLPDNLTAWRIVVLAATAKDKFGMGHTSIQSTKDTELRPIAPNVVTEGDSFQVGVSILNRSDRERELNVQLSLDGLVGSNVPSRLSRRVQLDPFERDQVLFGIDAGEIEGPPNKFAQFAGEIKLRAKASDRIDSDALSFEIPVRSSRTAISNVEYGVISQGTQSISYDLPDSMVSGTGQAEVEVAGNVIGSLDGAFAYVRSYPFGCWEQQLSKGLLAAQFNEMGKDYVHAEFTWEDSVNLPQETLENAASFQASNGGMTFFGAQDRHASPFLSAYTAMGFQWFNEMGLEIPKRVQEGLEDYLMNLLRNKDGMADYPRNLVASVRAVILNALASNEDLTSSDMRRYSSEIEYMDLFGLSHYLQALIRKGGNQDLVERTFERVMNHRTLIDGGVEFVDEVPNYFYTMLHSRERSNCAVLTALVAYSEQHESDALVADLAELAKVISLYRDKLSRWASTQSNAFCVNALMNFATEFQLESLDIDTRVTVFNNETGRSRQLLSGNITQGNRNVLRVVRSLGDRILGDSGTLEVSSQGNGNAFYATRLSFLIPATENPTRLSGIELERAYFVERDGVLTELKPNMVIQQGELVRTSLFLSVPSSRYFVVVEDSVAGGIEPVNRELATESEFSAEFGGDEIPRDSVSYASYGKSSNRGQWYFYHQEIGHSNVRFYANTLPAGKYHLHWVGQAINSGVFHVVAAHSEEMYRPTVFGKSEFHKLKIDD